MKLKWNAHATLKNGWPHKYCHCHSEMLDFQSEKILIMENWWEISSEGIVRKGWSCSKMAGTAKMQHLRASQNDSQH